MNPFTGASDNHYKDLADNASDIIQCVDTDGRFVYVNKKWMEKLGYNLEELPGMVLWDIIHPDSKEHCQEVFKDVMGGAGIYATQAIFLKKNGEPLLVEGCINCRVDKKGLVVSTRGIYRDITEKDSMLRVQREKDDKIDLLTWELEMVFNGSTDCMFLVKVEGDKFTYVRSNLAHQRSTGIRAECLKGRTPEELLGEKNGSRVTQNYVNCVARGEAISYEETIELPGGIKTWLTTLSPVVREGRVVNIVGSSVDITQKKETELALIRSETRTKAILASSQDIIFVLNSDLCVEEVYTPDLDLLYIKPADFLGENIEKINIPQPAMGQVIAGVKKVFLTGRPERIEYYLDLPGGRFWFDAQVSLYYLEGKKEGVIFTSRDISSRIKSDLALKDSEEKYRTLVENLAEVVVVIDQNGKIEYVTPNIEEISEFSPEEILRNKYAHYILQEDRKKIMKEFSQEISEKISVTEARLKARNGKFKWVNIKAKKTYDKDNNYYIQCVINDITERKMAEEEVKYLSYHDTLTGLYNRRYFDEITEKIDRIENLPLTVITADVNGLKLANDAYGHEMGDGLLKVASRILLEAAGTEDYIIRLGGDEFLIILINTGEEEAKKVVEKILNTDPPVRVGALEVSIAAGYSVKTSDDQDLNTVIANSDAAMYKNKLAAGKIMRKRLVDSIISELEESIPGEKEHIRRVGVYSAMIGKAIGLSPAEVKEVQRAARVHDIGKVALDKELFLKKDKLTAEEYALVKRHPEISYRILKTIDEYASLAEAVLYHHVRPDGLGYPEGLKAGEIPVLSSILSVADAFEAMTGKRNYKESLSFEDAILELRDKSGTQFNPQIVDAFINILSEGKNSVEKTL